MKKSTFKKAGAAVLSMSMLLSMGAVSLPTYAVNLEDFPGQVKVTVNGSSDWADDTSVNREFDYLNDVTSATVTMYRVATLGTGGWAWESDFVTALDRLYSGSTTTKLDDFRKLLTITTDASGAEHFTATSDELLQVASALERVTRDNAGQPNSIGYIDQETLTITNGSGFTYLPKDSLLDTTTKDTIGYYLITTTTDNAGVVLQPVLITLKNSNKNENPVEIALKGYEIDVEKTIDKVNDKDKNDSLGGTVVSSSGETAIVAKDDVITYKIVTEIPKYDVNLGADAMKAFTITDIPEEGIKVTESSGGSSPSYNPVNLVVKAGTTTLRENTDYTVANVSGNTNSFVITFPANVYHTTANTTNSKLEGQTITVTFDATIDDATFKTANYANADYSDLTATQATATDIETEAIAIGTKQTTYTTADSATASVDSNIYEVAGHSVEADVTEEDRIAAYLAVQEDTTNRTYGNLTADQINEKRNEAKELIAAHTTYTTAAAAIADDNADVKALFGVDEGADLGATKKLQAYLALQKLQATEAGNKNTATIKYGNEYATGQGDGNDEDDATVYSVDLDLTKITETIKLNKNDAYDADDKEDTWYGDDTTEEKVSGAVFELIKVDNSGNSVGDKSLGLAVSDANGKLWLLTEGTETETKPTIETTVETDKIVYYKTTSEGKYVPYTVSDTSEVTNAAWRKLTKGAYTLKELYAPAGYKTISDITLNVLATDDGQISAEYTGAFTSTTSADETIVKSSTNNGNPDYIGSAGSLQARIVDPKADELPATGGMGTVLFTAGGIAIVLMAGAMFVVYMKKREAEEE